MSILEKDCVTRPPATHVRQSYRTPALHFFGKIAVLTQSGSGCSMDDNATCDSGFNMGPPPMGSDRAIKENIVRIDEHPLGIGLYLFDYKPEYRDVWGHGRQFGVMAQDVEDVMPEAVSVHPDGYKMVNYGMLGFTRPVH